MICYIPLSIPQPKQDSSKHSHSCPFDRPFKSVGTNPLPLANVALSGCFPFKQKLLEFRPNIPRIGYGLLKIDRSVSWKTIQLEWLTS